MLEQLRIKCPSCGIFLDVRNSKHEAVKQVTCPNCHKLLAVDFRDVEPDKSELSPQPIGSLYHGEMRIALQQGVNRITFPGFDDVEIKVVQLNDGGNKCLVRPKNDTCPLMVNGELLQVGDVVSLADGDEVQAGPTVLTYNQPGKTDAKPFPVTPKHGDTPSTPGHSRWAQWAVGLMALLVAALAVKQFWPTPSAVKEPQPAVGDTIVVKPSKEQKPTPKTDSKKPAAKPKEKTVPNPTDSPTKAKVRLSSFELEKRALNGDVKAQHELGRSLVLKPGANNIIRGINYLRMAERQGSARAKLDLLKVVRQLRQQAADGDETATNILKSIGYQ